MTIIKPSTLPGFMELLPKDQVVFNRLVDIIKTNFEKYGFLPIDTPVLEKAEVLLAKGGGETEKQVYEFTKGTTDIAMRFDLTVPLARYTVEHFSDLNFPFKRYQIGKVYRGERAQKGRYREFYQCDIDIIGNGKISLVNDAECPAVIYSIFREFNFGKFTININNRKILNGFFKSLEVKSTEEVMRIIDKIDKIGVDNVKEELAKVGMSAENIDKLISFIEIDGTKEDIIEALKNLDCDNEDFIQGVEELETVVKYMRAYGVEDDYFKINLKIARGLDYYTGTVYETFLDDHRELGSVSSGGRYDNLAGYYTTNLMPGVGMSIGLTRLFSKMQELGLIKETKSEVSDIIIIPMEETVVESIEILSRLQKEGISATIYAESGKMGKKFKYADALDIKYALVIGENEIKSNVYGLKNMDTGEQEDLSIEEIIAKFSK
ncbi:histidine--tRNA ligase [Peptoniphilus sp.]|uniref:histidine--tRNA ligase n=1 Tax=Peptoniphilus sp. TaxID=1971214 RepID=UPI003992E451